MQGATYTALYPLHPLIRQAIPEARREARCAGTLGGIGEDHEDMRVARIAVAAMLIVAAGLPAHAEVDGSAASDGFRIATVYGLVLGVTPDYQLGAFAYVGSTGTGVTWNGNVPSDVETPTGSLLVVGCLQECRRYPATLTSLSVEPDNATLKGHVDGIGAIDLQLKATGPLAWGSYVIDSIYDLCWPGVHEESSYKIEAQFNANTPDALGLSGSGTRSSMTVGSFGSFKIIKGFDYGKLGRHTINSDVILWDNDYCDSMDESTSSMSSAQDRSKRDVAFHRRVHGQTLSLAPPEIRHGP